MRIATRRMLLAAVVLALLVGGSVLGGASASAEVVHNFEFSFDGLDTPNGSFEGLGNVALDQASGDVYVEDWRVGVVYRFDAAGKYLGEITGAAVPQGSLGLFFGVSGIAVDNSAGVNKGDVYISGTSNGVVYKFDSSGKLVSEVNGSGTPAGSFDPWGIAVDSSGGLYVADETNSVVDEFDASGKYVKQISSASISSPSGVAVDPAGNVYVADENGSTVKFEPGGAVSVLDNNRTFSVAVDPATGNVYVAEPGKIAEYNQSGARLGSFGEERLSSVTIAVLGVTGEVYAANTGGGPIDVFGPAVVIPDAVTEAASNVQPSSATLNGTVDPDGLPVTDCQFEYGTTTSYGQTAACAQSPSSLGSGTSPVPVSASIASLAPDTVYHVRLDASNANGANRQAADMAFTTTGPPRVDSQSATSVGQLAATLSAQIDPFGFDTTYHFEYGTSASYGTSVPIPAADIGSGMSDVTVSQPIGGLRAGITYHYRVLATSSQATVTGPDQTFTTIPPFSIDGVWASDVASTSATLDAQINPLGTSTEYRLEYGTSTSYGQTLTGNVGEGTGDVSVSYHRQDLQPDTTYHYRVMASNVLGTVEGVDHTFTTQSVAVEGESTLRDERAWELVSPPDKNGALLGFSTDAGWGLVQAASDGSGIAYQSNEPVGTGVQGRGVTQQMLSARSSQGWSTRDVAIPRVLPEEVGAVNSLGEALPEYGLFSSDLSVGLVDQPPSGATPLSPEATRKTALYLRDDATGSYSSLFVEAEGEAKVAEFRAATSDLSHVVLSSESALTPEAISEPCLTCQAGPKNLYEWSAGHLALVNILPGGEPSHPGVTLGGDGGFNNGFGLGVHALSSDGRWIAWVVERGASSGLYVRDMVGRRTERVGGASPLFQSMSSDGSKVFFLEDGDLHVFETGSETSSDLTAGRGTEPTAGVEETVLTSEDGSYLYFRATGVLAAGGVSGAQNLYVLHDGGGVWTTGFIASPSSEDGPSWYAEGFGTVNLAGVSSRVSPDGRYLAFMSNGSLTGYDNTDALSGRPDEEVYLYDAVTARLVCASCNPSGARPVGVLDGSTSAQSLLVDPTDAWGGHWLAGSIPGWSEGAEQTSAYQPRYLSDSGRLFFDSSDALVAQDSNGVEDVYEYEPPGVGDCTGEGSRFSVRSDGCVSLLSSGTSVTESAFVDASQNGSDVFFVTASKLSTADYDNSYDVYDARVCTAEAPCLAPPVSPPPCTSGDSCKAAPSAQPELFGPAPSATFSGTGNVVSQPSAVVRPKALTRSQKLARALAVCHKEKSRTRKAACERAAKKRYSAKQSRTARATRGGKR